MGILICPRPCYFMNLSIQCTRLTSDKTCVFADDRHDRRTFSHAALVLCSHTHRTVCNFYSYKPKQRWKVHQLVSFSSAEPCSFTAAASTSSASMHMPSGSCKPCACGDEVLFIHCTGSMLLPLLLMTALTPDGRAWLYRLTSGDLVRVALAARKEVSQVTEGQSLQVAAAIRNCLAYCLWPLDCTACTVQVTSCLEGIPVWYTLLLEVYECSWEQCSMSHGFLTTTYGHVCKLVPKGTLKILKTQCGSCCL